MAFSLTATLVFTLLAVPVVADCKDKTCASVPKDDHVSLLQGHQKLELGRQRGSSNVFRDIQFQRIAMVEAAQRFYKEKAQKKLSLIFEGQSAEDESGECKNNGAGLVKLLGGAEAAKQGHHIGSAESACATIKAQRWCMSNDDVVEGLKVSEWMGEMCPESCGWCECKDDVNAFEQECPYNPVCKEKSKEFEKDEDPCKEAAREKSADSGSWCNAENGEHKRWVLMLCRKSCCDYWASEGGKGKEHESCNTCRKGAAGHGDDKTAGDGKPAPAAAEAANSKAEVEVNAK